MKVYERLALIFIIVVSFYFLFIAKGISQSFSLTNQEIIDRLKLAVDWCENRECQLKLGQCLIRESDVRNCFVK